ncbi:hypothetical protein INR49_029761, partial [Caranx melampygus]
MAKVDLARVGKNLLKSAETAQSVELQSLWQDQPVVLFFLRRFGCQVCRWMASEISKLEPDLRASGVALVGIGPEEVGLDEFKEKGFFKGSIYVDDQKKSYKDLGFKRYTALSVVPAALGKKVRDVAAKVLLHFIQDSPGDHVPLEDISKSLGITAKVTPGQRPVFHFLLWLALTLAMSVSSSSTCIISSHTRSSSCVKFLSSRNVKDAVTGAGLRDDMALQPTPAGVLEDVSSGRSQMPV